MLIIAERINASRKYIAQAISSQNAAFIQDEAKAQDQAGADFIDVNAGTFVEEEAQRLRWVIEVVQEVGQEHDVSLTALLKDQCFFLLSHRAFKVSQNPVSGAFFLKHRNIAHGLYNGLGDERELFLRV